MCDFSIGIGGSVGVENSKGIFQRGNGDGVFIDPFTINVKASSARVEKGVNFE